MATALGRLSHEFNQIEIGIWIALGLFCAGIGMSKARGSRGEFFIASITMIAFGISDYAESITGNEWWRPWWLLMWKAACVAVLLALCVIALRKRRSI